MVNIEKESSYSRRESYGTLSLALERGDYGTTVLPLSLSLEYSIERERERELTLFFITA